MQEVWCVRRQRSKGVARLLTAYFYHHRRPSKPGLASMGCACTRLTQRWEASLWLTGKQLYLGGFESEQDAAHAYDLAALACKGRGVPTNFPASHYRAELAEVASYSQVLATWLRRA